MTENTKNLSFEGAWSPGRSGLDLLFEGLDKVDHGISILDSDLCLVHYNGKLAQMMELPDTLLRAGASLREILQFNARRGDYGPGPVNDLVEERTALAASGQPHRFERILPSGRIVEVDGSPLEGGGFVTTYKDITNSPPRDAEQEGDEASAKKH